MRRVLVTIGTGLASAVLLAAPAVAHQPVPLGPTDTTASRGPLLVDGTVSFAVGAQVERGDRRGFRFALKRGDTMSVQYLIVDAAPANRLPASQLPRVIVTDPTGASVRLDVNERTEFFEPYSRTAYLYLSRMTGPAVPGTYRVTITGRSASAVDVVIGVGSREVPGQVRR